MGLRDALASVVRRRTPTQEEIEARAEAKSIRAQMNQDKISQDSKAGMIYRSGRR
jgi:hypothetical protein